MRDVIVIGGGPAGCAAATLLAQRGHSVLVIEREPFPRLHVGESLLPACTPILERLGVDLSSRFLAKQGAEFIDEATDSVALFRFSSGYPDFPSATWQVERAEFDALLLERAKQAGAELRVDRVAEVCVEPGLVRATTVSGAVEEARYLIDASGQSTFLGRRGGSIVPCNAFGRAAAFAHYSGLDPDVSAELAATGNIKILLIPNGWVWIIPFVGDKVSVGFVSSDSPVTEEWFHQGVAASPLIQRLTRGATRSQVFRVGDFSYANLEPCGVRTVCIGDSAAFLDPVFSSGVALSLLSAAHMADLLGPALDAGAEGRAGLMEPLCEHLDVAYRTFANFIHRFYRTRLVQNLFFAEDPDPEIFRGIVAVLAGDLWRSDNPFQRMLLTPGGRRSFAWPPQPRS